MGPLSGATIPGQSGPGSNGNEGVLRIPQSPSITGTSPSDCLVSYLGHSLGGSYPSAELQSVYSTAPANWATFSECSYVCVIVGEFSYVCVIVYDFSYILIFSLIPVTAKGWRPVDTIFSPIFKYNGGQFFKKFSALKHQTHNFIQSKLGWHLSFKCEVPDFTKNSPKI